ncbi:hypothetical protein [Streptomyces scabiei]|uniref:hypothetical protein n=1 Tax=Streptomyces scabiei TaxID=1930 RepID=UPI001FF140A2|nr:hypothetical protein [Streptomyces sp. LBUM 1486]
MAVAYTATPLYADGTWGPSTSLAVTVPAPAVAQTKDLWIKSLETPGLSMRVMLMPAQGTTSAARMDSAPRSGSPYTAVAYDTAGAPSESVSVDVLAADIVQFRQLIRSGVLLAQVRPGYQIPTGTSCRRRGREAHRQARGDRRLHRHVRHHADRAARHRRPADGRPGWSYDAVEAAFATYDAVTASYATYAALATNGAVT